MFADCSSKVVLGPMHTFVLFAIALGLTTNVA